LANLQARPLTTQEQRIFAPYFSREVIEQARIIDGKVPFWLRRDMCAVVLKFNIYFREGVYCPNTPAGVALLGHELTHVAQFISGLNWWRYLWSCRYGYQNSPYEIEAMAKGRLIAVNFQQNRVI
jgi:hypothetical protein